MSVLLLAVHAKGECLTCTERHLIVVVVDIKKCICLPVESCIYFSVYTLVVYSANTSGFPTLETVMDTDAAGQLPDTDVFNNARLWLFPSMNFSCSGNITGWIFQAETSDDGTDTELPRMQVWRENSLSVGVLDYLLQSTSGSEDELSKVGESVYVYVLESPVPVEEGDILGLSLPPATDRKLLLQFQDFGNLGAPESYLTPTSFSIFINVDQIGVNAQFLPLVTAIIGE